MPRISIFFGIVIYMYYDDHYPPHFHAMYEGEEALFDLRGTCVRGFMPERALRLIEEWSQLHVEDLRENWQRARDGLSLNWIEPLR